MSEAPKVIWAQQTAVGWEELHSTIYQVDHFHKYHHDDTVTALQAKVARYEAALIEVRNWSSDVKHAEIARQALKEATND